MVKLIFVFWAVVIIGIIIVAIASNPWLLMLAVLFLIIGIATAIVNYEDKREAGKKITNDKPNKDMSLEKDNEEISKTAPDIIKTNEETDMFNNEN